MSHASFATTMRYRKVAGQELRQWYQKLWDEKMTSEPLRPAIGGFLRPFRCSDFIHEFLESTVRMEHRSLAPPEVLPSQIWRYYKEAIIRETAVDKATRREERQAKRERRQIDPERIEALTRRYIELIPYKTTSSRYHSFVVYFSNLKRLGWVEETGETEKSEFQDRYPTGQPRRYYRLTAAGRAASETEWANPHQTLYGKR